MCYRFIPPLALLFLLLACNGKGKQNEESEEENYAKIEQQEEKTIVKVQVAREDRFNLELVSNGKAEANRKATLNFEVPDVVRQVNVKNGDRVRQGDVIAVVDDVKAKQTLENTFILGSYTKKYRPPKNCHNSSIIALFFPEFLVYI